MARRAGLSESEAQDVVQETVLSVAKHLPSFRYDPSKGSFKTWLYQVTRCRIYDHFRQRTKWRQNQVVSHFDGGASDLVDRLPDEHAAEISEAIWEREWRQNLIDRAMARIKHRISPKHYQIFDLYVVKECPVARIRATLNVSRTQIYLVKHRVSSLIKQEVQKLQREMDETP